MSRVPFTLRSIDRRPGLWYKGESEARGLRDDRRKKMNLKIDAFAGKDGVSIRILEGRKVITRLATTLTLATAQGIAAAADGDLPHDDLAAVLLKAIDEAAARRGSVIPDGYRHQYGVDQNCGDRIAKALTAKVTTAEGVDLNACREIAGDNEVEDKFDRWMAKGLNPGMIRMNLGNVLRGKARRGEEVIGL
jgi:hypothetical protein